MDCKVNPPRTELPISFHPNHLEKFLLGQDPSSAEQSPHRPSWNLYCPHQISLFSSSALHMFSMNHTSFYLILFINQIYTKLCFHPSVRLVRNLQLCSVRTNNIIAFTKRIHQTIVLGRITVQCVSDNAFRLCH